ncbi:MAG: hypothetical protein KY442_01595, partial [Proteobacteria bacterium]|nr:hypothetical protein [Pseudomonadota bacterium]
MGADLPAQRDPFAVNLLWTGGWDSTFQLLRLLIDFRRPVIPHYLIDAARPSSAVEIMTMDRIRARLLRDFPDAAALLPTRAFGVSLVERDEAIEAAYRSVRSESSIGEQYDWLARFCMQNGIQDMELCIHKDDKAHPVVAPFVAAQTDPHGYRTFRLDPQFEGSREYAVFGRFSCPLLDFSKLDMAAHAQQRGWTEV